MTKCETRDQYDKLLSEDPELAGQFLEKANELLTEKGIDPVLSDAEEEALAEAEEGGAEKE